MHVCYFYLHCVDFWWWKITVKHGKHTIHGSCGYRTHKPFRKNMSGNEAVSHSTGSPDTCCSDRILRMLWVQNIQTRCWEVLKSVQFLNWTSTYRTYNDRYVHVCGFCSKFFYPKSSLILVSMGLRFFPLSFGRSCPNTRSICKRFIFLQGYLARGTFSRSTLTRNCYRLYHFLLANLSCHVFLQHFSACLRAAFHILQSFCWMRNWNLQFLCHALTTLHVCSSKHVCFVALY